MIFVARASRVGIPRMGMSRLKAIAFAVAIPILNPVKLPGPKLTATPERSFHEMSREAKIFSISGKRRTQYVSAPACMISARISPFLIMEIPPILAVVSMARIIIYDYGGVKGGNIPINLAISL